ncbi:hypothetical protein [Oryzobacter terrae]|uniref:hypothetical protein n=1 Tax=Oryzobacter terrae TaxID=1620385 RepID=UPI003670DEA8
MGRHTAPRRRGPLVVTGAAAGLLTATGLVVGFSPELGTHALDRPPTLRAAPEPSSVAVTTPATPAPTPSEDATRARTDEGTASRGTPRGAAPTVTPDAGETPGTSEAPAPTTSPTSKGRGTPAPASTRKPGRPTPSPSPSSTATSTDDDGRLGGLLSGVPILP